MKAYVFPGQGAQFTGMGKDFFDNSQLARDMFRQANEILGFNVTDMMFSGTAEELKQTKVTQPAVFIHSVIAGRTMGAMYKPDMVAGHSLGEFSALCYAGALSFEDGLTLVSKRAMAMQKACDIQPGTMAAVVGAADELVDGVCKSIENEVVVAANFNSPGQVVVSGSLEGISLATTRLKEAGVKKVLPLTVGGAFHSPLMEPARQELAEAIASTTFMKPSCPVYQNVDALLHTDPEEIKANLMAQLTSPVRWTQSVKNMIADGAEEFYDFGPGQVLQNLIARIRKSLT